MSESQDDKVARARRALFGDGSALPADRPLDALLPGLRAAQEPRVLRAPFHPRVIEQRRADGDWSWILACVQDPGDQRTFHKQLLALLEATLLQELSRPPHRVAAQKEPRRFVELLLLVYPTLPYPVEPAVAAFGCMHVWEAPGLAGPLAGVGGADAMAEVPASCAAAVEALARESAEQNLGLGPVPRSIWRAGIQPPTEAVWLAEQGLAKASGKEVWGAEPGRPSHRMAAALADQYEVRVDPTRRGLDSLERVLVGVEPGVIRWIPTALFQAACDLVGVIAGMEGKVEVDWALCEEDASGMAPPPIFRIRQKGGRTYHVPIAHHLLRWWMMPLNPGEQVPPLSRWLDDQFG
jgi:hypothetical protein